MPNIYKIIMLTVLILNGILFVSNIYVIGNTEAAISMHEDLAPSASAFMTNAKVIICFIAGILYLLTAYSILGKKHKLMLSGVIGAASFIGFYIVELLLWGRTHLWVWIGFSIFGSIALLIGTYSYLVWRKAI